jgi:hypothetical protein
VRDRWVSGCELSLAKYDLMAVVVIVGLTNNSRIEAGYQAEHFGQQLASSWNLVRASADLGAAGRQSDAPI